MEQLAWLALYLTPGLGPVGCRRLSERFGGAEGALRAGNKALLAVAEIKEATLTAIGSREVLDAARREMERAKNEGVHIIVWSDSRYPVMLRPIHNPPVVLYVKGNPDFLGTAAIGMVGARAASSYGLRVAEHFGRALSEKGIAIVSGLALGIDAAAHRGALQGRGGTVAVLGCGVDVVYPPQNVKLYRDIAEKGAIVSEYPFRTKPDGFRFPPRNRIISGLSHGVVIVEAARKSGSLITADYALDQGREVFAVPGCIDSKKSDGVHRLLQEGAKLVHTIEDILVELPMLSLAGETGEIAGCEGKKTQTSGLDVDERTIHAFLEAYPKSIDEVIRGTGLSAQKAAEILIRLELKGLIQSVAGRQYVRSEL